jgi:hypothetical protein
MGRRPWSSRLTCEQCNALSISTLWRAGLFRFPQGHIFTLDWVDPRTRQRVEATATLSRRSHNEWLLTISRPQSAPLPVLSSVIPIIRIPCNFGGWRYLFLCPQVREGRLICRRRAAKLFRPPGQATFGCRRCFNLTYRSVQQHDQRVDNLANDLDRLRCALTCGNLKLLPLGVKAYRKLKERLNRSPQSEQRTLSRLAKNAREWCDMDYRDRIFVIFFQAKVALGVLKRVRRDEYAAYTGCQGDELVRFPIPEDSRILCRFARQAVWFDLASACALVSKRQPSSRTCSYPSFQALTTTLM